MKKLVIGSKLFAVAFIAGCSSKKTESQSTAMPESSAPIIGVNAESAPIVEASLETVSADLSLSPEQVTQQAKILATFLALKPVPGGFCLERRVDNESVCSLIDEVRESAESEDAPLDRGRRVPIRPHHFAIQQAMTFGRLNRSMVEIDSDRVFKWVPQLLETKSCPRNLSAAAIRKLESLLPDPSAREAMEELYTHAAACLKVDDDAYFTTHFRQALLRTLWGDADKGLVSIRLALLAKDERERSRTLYWGGRLEKSQVTKKKLWDKIITDYPLSYHALEVWRERQTDPLQIFSQRPQARAARAVSDPRTEKAIKWLEALTLTKNRKAADVLSQWIGRQYRDVLSPSNLLYISNLKNEAGGAHSAMRFMARQMNSNPVMISNQTLKILFPRPYRDIFENAGRPVDPFLLFSVARQESAFNPLARSPANARGILQILPATARVLTGKRKTDLYDPALNARLGTQFLSNLVERTGSVELALAAYNAGPNRIPVWRDRYPSSDELLFLDLIPFQETRNYVSNILRNNYWYIRLYGEPVSINANVSDTKIEQKSHIVSRLIEAHSAQAR
jgi:soluble lytic murein transglycosylase